MSKTAVISGVGSGLGAALVRKFASEGYQVGLLARSPDYIQELAEELLQGGVRALALPTDITDPQQVIRSFARVREELGPVDVLINHAGNASWKDFHELTPDEFEQSWRVCAYGSFLCAQGSGWRYAICRQRRHPFHRSHLVHSGPGRCPCFQQRQVCGARSSLGIGPRAMARRHSCGPRYHRRGAGYPPGARGRVCRGGRTSPEYRRRSRRLLESGAAGQRCLGFSRSICGPTMRDSSSEVNYPGVRAVAIIQPHHQSRHRGMVLAAIQWFCLSLLALCLWIKCRPVL